MIINRTQQNATRNNDTFVITVTFFLSFANGTEEKVIFVIKSGWEFTNDNELEGLHSC